MKHRILSYQMQNYVFGINVKFKFAFVLNKAWHLQMYEVEKQHELFLNLAL